jgi:hypothetical protein
MADNTAPGFGDLLGMFGGSNPLGGITKSVGQFQKGVAEFLVAIENFNNTMEQFNLVAQRVNGLLDTVEEPIKAFVPQVTRTIKAADSLVTQLSAPIEKVAPGLSRLADTLSSPVLTSLPTDLGDFVEIISDLAKRLQPLGQLAESAGSMFGLRPFAGLRTSTRSDAPAPPPPAVHAAAKQAAARKAAPIKKAAPTKAAAKKAAPAKKVAAPKKSAAKKR